MPDPGIACSLFAEEARRRSQRGAAIAAAGLISFDPTPCGDRLRFGSEMERALRDLVEAEADCCPFLEFDLINGGPSTGSRTSSLASPKLEARA